MINATNIKAYIDFLYRKRYGSAAPQELMQKWGNIDEQQITSNLQKLYEHWALSTQAAKVYEQQFLEFSNPVAPNITPQPKIEKVVVHNTQSTNTETRDTKKKSIAVPLILFCAACLVAGYAYNYFTSNNYKSAAPSIAPTELAPANTVAPTQAEPIIADSAQIADSIIVSDSAVTTSSDVTSTDNFSTYQSIAQQLIKADEQEDINNITDLFSENIIQYYDKAYPTKETLAAMYRQTWANASNRRYYDVSFERLGTKGIIVKGMLEYYSTKKEEIRNVPFSTTIGFGEDGKIIYQNKN
jgi:flagellar basal body-associated protein FliL